MGTATLTTPNHRIRTTAIVAVAVSVVLALTGVAVVDELLDGSGSAAATRLAASGALSADGVERWSAPTSPAVAWPTSADAASRWTSARRGAAGPPITSADAASRWLSAERAEATVSPTSADAAGRPGRR